MKKILIPLFLMAVLATAIVTAQTRKDKPEKIVSFVQTEHDAQWYANQASLWEKEVQKDPKNDDAWYYWFTATRYKLIYEFADDDTFDKALSAIAEKIHKERPNSYARYVIDHCCANQLKNPAQLADIRDNMLKAIKMRPDFEDMYPAYVFYLFKEGNTELMADVLKRWYDTGGYSYSLLSYAYNCLVGTDENAILFVAGDIETYGTLMLQHAKGLFKDRTIISLDLLFRPEYVERICRQLGIEYTPMPLSNSTREDRDRWMGNLVSSIEQNTKRPVYFASSSNPHFLRDQLYSEGLVLKYSTRRYDNLSVKRRNFESVYLTDYLYETLVPETYTTGGYRVNLNYIPCFKSLLDFYKAQGMTTEYNRLRNLMLHIVDTYRDKSDGVTQRKKDNLEYYYNEIDR